MSSRQTVGLPLGGRTIVITRAVDQNARLRRCLEERGATVIEVPVITVTDPPDGLVALRNVCDRIAEYEWLVFTSAHAARRTLTLLRSVAPGVSIGAGDLRFPLIAVVGPATADAVESAGFTVALVPDRNLADGLVEAFPSGRGRVLFPRAVDGRDVVDVGLRRKGWTVDLVHAYATVAIAPDPASLASAATGDAITFTSSSTVDAFVSAPGSHGVLDTLRVVCIGPVTAATAIEAKVRVDRVAEPHTLDGLVAAVIEVLG